MSEQRSTCVIAKIDGREYQTTTTRRYVNGEMFESFSNALGYGLHNLRRGWGEYDALTSLYHANNDVLKIIETVDKSANTRIQRLESDIVRYERMVKELRERIEVLEMKQELEQKQNEFENWFMETHSFALPE